MIEPEEGAGGPFEPLFQIITPTQLALAVIGVIGLMIVRQLLAKKEPAYLAEVRNLATLGEFGKAGELQFNHGNYDEAYNLFVRGKVWDRASVCAERLGRDEKAAEHARQSGNLERAAKLLQKAGRHFDAAKLFVKAGRHHSAAQAASRDDTATPEQLTRHWEAAFKELLDDERPATSEKKQQELIEVAKKAAGAYAACDDSERATYFERLTDPAAMAEHMKNRHTEVKAELAGPTATAVQPLPSAPGAADATRAGGAPPQDVLDREQRAAAERMGLPAVGATAADRYELLEKLGEGGMGVVYRARDNVLDRDVALKFLPETLTANDMARQMFAKEAKAAAAVNHPNIITIFDFGVMQGRPFLCMEFVDGHTVRTLLDQTGDKGLSIAAVLDIAEGLFSALAYAHGRNVVHRDVKPPNLMVTKDGVTKLADFGIAKLIEPGNTATKVIGTPAYMAPEQFVGRGIDHRTDIFAAGVTLYELLTCQLPYEGADRNRPPVALRTHRPEIPEELEQVLMACIAADSAARPDSAGKLVKRMRKLRARFDTTGEPSAAPRPSAAPQPAADAGAPKPAAGGDSAWARLRRRSRVAPETGYAMVKSGRKDDLDPERQQEGLAGTLAVGPENNPARQAEREHPRHAGAGGPGAGAAPRRKR